MEFFPVKREAWKAERDNRAAAGREPALSQLAVGVLAAVTGAETAGALAAAIGCDRSVIARHWHTAPAFARAVTAGGQSWTAIHATAAGQAVEALRADGAHWLPRFGELVALAVESHSDNLTPGPLARGRRIDAARTLARFERLGLVTDTGTILTAPADHPPLAAKNRQRTVAAAVVAPVVAPVRELVTAGAPATAPTTASYGEPLFDGPVERVWDAYMAARTEWAETHARDRAHAEATAARLKLGQAQRRMIERAIRWTDEDTVAAAVVGWLASPWHRGDNPEGTVWHSLSWLLKSPERIVEMADRTVMAAPHRAGSVVGTFDPALDGPIAMPGITNHVGTFDPALDGPVAL